jgi:hypothetical protein
MFGGSSTASRSKPSRTPRELLKGGGSPSKSHYSSEESSSHLCLVESSGIPTSLEYSSSFSQKTVFLLVCQRGSKCTPQNRPKVQARFPNDPPPIFSSGTPCRRLPLHPPHSSVVTSRTPLSKCIKISSIYSRVLSVSYTGFIPICPT